MAKIPFPFLDLFERMRDAKILLTLEQYDLLRQALEQGYGWESWAELRRICRLLWLKPNMDEVQFDRVFDAYVEDHQQCIQDWVNQLRPPSTDTISTTPKTIPLGVLPKVPPRIFSGQAPPAPQLDQPDQASDQAPTAAKTRPPKSGSRAASQFALRDLPISLETVKTTWRSLRQPLPDPGTLELDLEATLAIIKRDGFFHDVVERPVLRKRAELLLLIDDHAAMRPYRPVWQPLVQAIEDRRLAPAQIYRFTTYPDQFLYDWQRPLKATAIDTVLSRLHRQRTIAVILSDGGAASQTNHDDRVIKMQKFLDRLHRCVRSLLWLNPVPESRWAGTSAEILAHELAGRMLPFDRAQWQAFSRSQRQTILGGKR